MTRAPKPNNVIVAAAMHAIQEPYFAQNPGRADAPETLNVRPAEARMKLERGLPEAGCLQAR